MFKILVIDDHAILRQGVIRILEAEHDIEAVFDEAVSALDANTKILEKDYDLILLDISLPNVNGLDFLKQLHSEKPGLRVLILSMHPEEQYAIRALSFGAVGYMTKDSAPDELAVAVKKILAGGRYVSSSLAERMAAYLAPGKKAEAMRHEILSDREHQIFLMICSGRTPTHIADVLCLSVKTVGTYRTRILKKMGMKNNAEMMNYAHRNNLMTNFNSPYTT